MRPLFFLILMYPLLELWVLIEVGSRIGGLAVLGLILLSGMLGLAVIRRAGWQTLLRARSAVSPAVELTDGMLLGGAGLLLFLPGLIGDALGLLMLLPGARRGLVRQLLGRLIVVGRNGAAGPFGTRSRAQSPANVIEGEFSRVSSVDTSTEKSIDNPAHKETRP
jgi:UPF0716 protein FxsA